MRQEQSAEDKEPQAEHIKPTFLFLKIHVATYPLLFLFLFYLCAKLIYIQTPSMLNLPDTASKILLIAVFVTADFQAIHHAAVRIILFCV
jgi:hypothetical protein